MSLVSDVLGFVKSFSTRVGIDRFVAQYTPVAEQIVRDLIKVRNNADFLSWKDAAFAQVKEVTGEVKDTWVSIVVASAAHLLGEGTKPGNFFVNLFKKVFGFLSKRAPSLTDLLHKYGEPAVELVQRLLAANTNATFKDIERDAIAQLRALYGELSTSAAGLIINAVFEALKSQQRSV